VERNKLQADEMEEDPFDVVQEILKSDRYTVGEKECVQFHLGMLDGFSENLWEAITQADDENLARLAKGFPEEIAAYHCWKRGELGHRLRDDGLNI
jgi:hypothetical protein